YLDRQVEERLQAALDTLSGLAEVKSDGIEWEGHERPPALGEAGADDQIRWQVCDDQGDEVQRSRNLAPGSDLAGAAADPDWQVVQLRVASSNPHVRTTIRSDPSERRYKAVVLTAGVSLRPVRATLRTLALASGGLSLLLWSLAAVIGRALCRRAL